MVTPPAIPFVVGQWVRGDRFYGRTSILTEILQGPRESFWLLGTRRIGKTSLLKEIELQASAAASPFVPLFWDFQGADNPGELHATFHDALLDSEPGLAALGVDLDLLDPQDLFASLNRRIRAHT